MYGPYRRFPSAFLLKASLCTNSLDRRGRALGSIPSIGVAIRSRTLFLLAVAALSVPTAVATAALGWIHASNGHGAGSRQILAVHRWIGTAAASWAVATAIFSEWNTRRGERRGWFRAWLLVGAVLIAIEGHVGGMLVHGDDFLSGG